MARGLDSIVRMKGRLRLALAYVVLATAAGAMPPDALDADQSLALRRLEIRGADAVATSDVTEVMVTQPRAWWALWRDWPPLDAPALVEDVERIRSVYRRHGFYEAAVSADVALDAGAATAAVVVSIDEGMPVRVAAVDVTLAGDRVDGWDALVAALPVRAGEVFQQRDYDAARRRLRRAYRDAGYARVVVDKHARVDLDTHAVAVAYAVRSGSPCVFGSVTVTGTQDVDPAVVRAEVAFQPGDPFREKALERTRTQLQATRLFQVFRVEEEAGTGNVVDVHVDVHEAPPRDVRAAVGYDTDEGPRIIAGWRHYDFLGGGRQLGFTVRASQIEQSAAADLLQPHWPTPSTRVRLLVAQQQDDEDSYDLARSTLAPRLEWQVDPDFAAFVFERLEYDALTSVPAPVSRALPHGAPRHSILSGLGVGIDLVRADDPLDPTRGYTVAATLDGAGLGGDVHLVRLVCQGAAYYPLGFWGLFGAARLRLGVVRPIAGDDEVPLFERFYAGGTGSVRGYERRHIGPLAGGDPIGGRTLVETSAELRRAIVGKLGGALFVDAGQVGLRDDRLPIDHLQVGVGVGVRYASPVGPIRVDLGFPLDRPRGDAIWQLHVSLGRAF